MQTNQLSTTEYKSYFENPKFLNWLTFLAILNNLHHAAATYHSLNNGEGLFPEAWMDWVHTIFVMLIIDLSLMAFVVNRRWIETAIYAIMILGINLIFWGGVDIFDFEGTLTYRDKLINQKVLKLIYSFMFAYSIFIFSYLYFKKIKTRDEAKELRKKREEDAAQIRRLSAELRDTLAALRQELDNKNLATAEIEGLTAKLKEATAEVNALTAFKRQTLENLKCVCGYAATSSQGLNAHKKSCNEHKVLSVSNN